MPAIRVLIVAMAGLFLVASPVEGQMAGARPIRLVIGGGLTVPTGDFEESHDLGYHANAALLINLPGFPLQLRPEASYTRFDFKDQLQGGTGGYGEEAYSQLLGAFGNIEIPLGMGLYVMAGVGALNFKTDPGSGGASLSSTEFAINGGAGLRLNLGGVSLFVEGRLNNVYTDQGALNLKDVRVIPVTFGLVF